MGRRFSRADRADTKRLPARATEMPRAADGGQRMPITPMRLKKAVRVAERGPKTEAQRVQAINTLRKAARDVVYTLPETARDLRAAARRLSPYLPLQDYR